MNEVAWPNEKGKEVLDPTQPKQTVGERAAEKINEWMRLNFISGLWPQAKALVAHIIDSELAAASEGEEWTDQTVLDLLGDPKLEGGWSLHPDQTRRIYEAHNSTLSQSLPSVDGAQKKEAASAGSTDAVEAAASIGQATLKMLITESRSFHNAVEKLLDWMNGNDLSADHEEQCPGDYKVLCAELQDHSDLLRYLEGKPPLPRGDGSENIYENAALPDSSAGNRTVGGVSLPKASPPLSKGAEEKEKEPSANAGTQNPRGQASEEAGRTPTGFTKWFLDLLSIAQEFGYSRKAIQQFNANDWKEYFEGGLTPKQALAEDESNA